MKLLNKITLIVLLVLLLATVYGLIHTQRGDGIPAGTGAAATAGSGQAVSVDQTPLLTAQGLASMPTSAVELPFARGALQLADQEMDLAFALAVLDATQHPPTLTAEAKKMQARLAQAEDALAAEQARVTQLTAADAKAGGAQKNALDDQLKLAHAQVELAQDEADDAKQEFDEAGGNLQDRIEAMAKEHEAASQVSDATKLAVTTPIEPHGLIQRSEQWLALHRKQLQLWRAKQDAVSMAATLARQHEALRQSGAESNAPVATLEATQHRAADRKTLATLDRRVDDEIQLAGEYGQWINVVAAEQRALVAGALRGVLLILAIAIIALFIDFGIGSLVGKMSMDRRQVATLQTATRVTLQIVVVLLSLLVILGPPTQLGTFLGLAGAGLTVALKDFIIGFFGWFVLMGKNGIRLGDWVEINGVTGEVVELGMFHTVLLETGNWTDSGHPTGRRVTFTNSFAVEGHYFNFSTSGQWLWDELQIVLPAGQNPYPMVEAIQKIVVDATSEAAKQAEMEWKGAAKSRDAKISAAPAINVKPVIGGVEISVRYVTRANERSSLRAKLNHSAVDLLGSVSKPGSTPGWAPVSKPGSNSVAQPAPAAPPAAGVVLQTDSAAPQPDPDSPKPTLIRR
jgi:small-conductance mechanosensitive channel